MFKYLLQIWNSKDLRRKILFTLFAIALFRLVAHITIPGINLDNLKLALDQNRILGIFSMLTGGSVENFSVILMGLSPYINASIIMQLMTVISPKIEAISKEGEQGRQTINKYTRWLAFPLAFLQSYGMIALLNSQANMPIIENIHDPKIVLPLMLTISTGTLFLMWLGELITEKGISNGISILICAGIIANVPTIAGQTLALAQQTSEKIIPAVFMAIVTIVLTVIIVLVTEGHRKVPITYATRGMRGRGEQAAIPIRINQAGMIPIIFAVSLVSFPSVIANLFLNNAKSEWLQNAAQFVLTHFQPQGAGYLLGYFLLIIGFTFFYVSITFNPDQMAETIQKRGGFIPGIRPGKQTANYLRKVSSRLNLFGGIFLAFIAITPMLLQIIFGKSNFGSVPLLISGAGMIIIVGVILEIIRQINAQLVMHDYDKLY